MKSEHYDLIVVGAGSAARDGANKAAREYGAKVALIEKERWGGSCPNGACTVGLEFGQAFSRFGSKVTLVDALDEIAPHTDQHAAMELREALEAEGIPIILGSFVQKVAARNGNYVATIVPREGGMEQEV